MAIQFAISLALLSGSILITQQLKYISKKDLGFDHENILVINHASDLKNQIKSFRDELQDLSGVVNASISMDMPGRGSWEDFFMREGSDIKLAISQLKIDPFFFPTMKLRTVAGRSFEKHRTADVYNAIINETTAKLWDGPRMRPLESNLFTMKWNQTRPLLVLWTTFIFSPFTRIFVL